MKDPNGNGRLRVREKVGYALGDYACDLYFMFFIYYALFFYTDVFGIPAAVVGTMFFVTKFWDAVNDPLMGIIADRTETRWGKFRPYIIWMFIPFGVIGTLTFTTPQLNMTWKIIYAYGFYTLINMVYTAINIPYSALMGVMTSNSAERTSLSSYRFVAAYAGGATVSGLTLVLAAFYGGNSNHVLTARTLSDHRIEIVEQGVGTVQLQAEFDAITDETAAAKAGWAVELQGLFENLKQVKKNTTIWVKPKDTLINQLVYEDESRAKALAAWAALDDTLEVSDLQQLDKKTLQTRLMRHCAENPKPLELVIDGNYYLESGFGRTTIDANALWDDTSEEVDVWAESRKVDWTKPIVRLEVIDQQRGFQLTIGTFAIIAMMMFVLTFISTKERVQPPRGQRTGIARDLKTVLTNRHWLIVAVMSLFTLSYVCIYGAAIMYYFKYYIGTPILAGAFQLVGTVTNLIGAVLTRQFTRLWGSKKRVYFIHSMVMALIIAGYYFPGRDDLGLLFLMVAVGGLISGPLSPIVWAMFADIADHSEWRAGYRATGLFYSAGTFSQKMGWTVGIAFSGWILAWYGFEANITQTPETLVGIKSLMSWIPAACALVGGCLVLFYGIDDELMVRIENDLKERRAGRAGPSSL